MLWTLRSSTLRPLQRCLSRNISFTPNSHLPRITRSLSKNTPSKTLSFRESIARAGVPKSFVAEIKTPSIRNQVILFLVGSFVVFSIAAEESNVETEWWVGKLSEASFAFKFREPTSDEIKKARQAELGRKLQAGLAQLKDATEGWSQTVRSLAVWSYIQVFQPILDAGDGKRVCWAIGAANTFVWAAWQFPRFQPFMMKHFAHNPLSGLSYTFLTSMFSHKSILHLALNCMALASFGSAASLYLRSEQQKNSSLREANISWHFLAFYLSSGLFSGMASHIMTTKFIYPRMIQRMATEAKTINAAPSVGAVASETAATAAHSKETILPSLGASGAIYAAVTLTALAFPHTEIALMIPPSFPIPIQWGVGGLVVIDIIGALRGWRMFDHWAHLGGAAFGVWYYNYGPQMWEFLRRANLGLPSKGQSSKEVPRQV
ncbi:hypothetical protein PHLGIDRAFT_106145 [Phlebiopsis gigantea 11061_1 CR5-6]|uniref:Peptidase S54 rhomboid domain-containing protein n=1 Tax=Phlebiopsis gigantea (strain 11061_1 CR5-6) TaxID=745531 RepID=A0A0C3SAJ0_PHLG1|nr:hypothetical protein PHLGIDRAFT_106145 [Phlebiopsis gigantea 11061_1 CR5-6]